MPTQKRPSLKPSTRPTTRRDAGHGTATQLVAGQVAHEIAGRLRIRLSPGVDKTSLQALVERIADCGGVRRVVARPNTGSVIIEGAGPAGAIRQQLEQDRIMTLQPPEKSESEAHTPPPLGQVAKLGLAQLDAAIKNRSESALNLHSALAAAMLVGAVAQALRGKVAGPATALAFNALSLLERAER